MEPNPASPVIAESGAEHDERCEPEQDFDALERDFSPTHMAWGLAGLACFGLGAIGAVVPLLPTTPFLLLAAFCFARSSRRLDTWFKGTSLYKKVLADYVSKRAMTTKVKLTVMVPVTLVMAVGFAFMGSVPVGRAILAVVWAAHVIYFGFIVKTEKPA